MTVPVPLDEKEALAAMSKLLSNRTFQKMWIENTTKALLCTLCESDERACSARLNANHRSKSVTVRRILDDLTQQIHLSLETFSRSVDLALCHFEASAVNRDASSLYSARVHIDRFLAEKEFILSHFEQNSRRISQLLRLFTQRISTPFHIANCAFFASILADILYRIEEYCIIQGRIPVVDTQNLKNATDSFNLNVVQRLNAKVIDAKRRGLESKSPPKKSVTSPGTFKDFLDQKTPPKSYLLPAHLERVRNKVAANQPKRSQSAYSALNSSSSNSKRRVADSEAERLKTLNTKQNKALDTGANAAVRSLKEAIAYVGWDGGRASSILFENNDYLENDAVAQQLVKESMPQISREVESALRM